MGQSECSTALSIALCSLYLYCCSGTSQHCVAKQSKAKQSKAKQSKAKQSKAKQSKAKQSKAKQIALQCAMVLIAL